MPSLEIEIPVDRALAATKQIREGVKSIGDQAVATEASTKRLGAGLNSAFQATSGGISVATGIAQTASSLSNLNVAAAGFSASRVFLEIGKTAQDFRELRTAVGGVGGAWGTLTALWRASPIGLIATGISLAATAMSLFSSNTRDATTEIKQQVTALDQLRAKLRDTEQRVALGAADPRLAAGSRIDVIRAFQDQRYGARVNATEAASLLGVSEVELRQALGRVRGVGDAALEQRSSVTANPFGGPRYAYRDFTAEQLAEAGRSLLPPREQPTIPTSGPFRGPNIAGDIGWMQGVRDGRYQPGPDLAAMREAEERRQEDLRRANEQLQQMRDTAVGIGEALGGAFASALTGAQSLRQALASVLQQLLATGLTKAGGALGGAIFDSFGGAPNSVGASPGSAGQMVPGGGGG